MDDVLWHTQMSLDGFIAGPDDDMRWAFEVEAGPDETIDEVVSSRCLEADLVDEVLVHVTPVLLGDGVRLLSRPGGVAIKLERRSVRESGQLTALRFSVKH